MKSMLAIVLASGIGGAAADVRAAEVPPPEYDEALELIHASGELGPVFAIADALSRSHPSSGYSQTLLAEAFSTWRLSQKGHPEDVRIRVLELADEALRLNPRLAQAQVAKARAHVRSARYAEA